MNLTSKNLLLFGVLGIGAFWFLTQRRAVAATPAVNPITGGRQPSNGTYAPTPANQNAAGWGQAFGAAWNLFTNPSKNTSSPGYTPSYVPDNAGEAPARQFYLDNQDSFAVNPPVITDDMYNRAQIEGASDY